MRWIILFGLLCLAVAACPRSQLTGGGNALTDNQDESPPDLVEADGQRTIECVRGICATDADCGLGLACEVATCNAGCCAYELLPDGSLLPGSGSVCWGEAACEDGRVAGAGATALNQKCQMTVP